jgi:hypothetical protein
LDSIPDIRLDLINCYDHQQAVPCLISTANIKFKTTLNYGNGCSCMPNIDPFSEETFPF